MSIPHPEHFTDDNFEAEVLGSEQTVVVDFWSESCGPCRALGPVVDQLARVSGDNARVGKIDVYENPKTAQAYGIQSIPSVLFFRDGEVVDRLVGVHDLARYQEVLRSMAAA